MARASSFLQLESGRSSEIRHGSGTLASLEGLTAVALGLMVVRFTVGLVADPFYPVYCIWVYRVAVVLLVPGFIIALLRPSSWLPVLMTTFSLVIFIARVFDADNPETYLPVVAGTLTAISATTIRGIAALRALCWTFGALAMAAALLLLAGDFASGGFRGRLGYGWSAAYALEMRLPPNAPPIFNPNEAALSLAMLLSFALSLVPAGSGMIARASGWLMAVCVAVTLILTGSRGMMVAGFLGFAISIRAFVAGRLRISQLIALLPLTLSVAIGMATLSNELWADSLSRGDLSDDLATLGDRYPIWESSLNRLLEHPIFGPGRELMGVEVLSPHNAVISAGELSGMVGASIFVLLLIATLLHVRHSKCFGAPIAICVFAAGLSMDTLTHPLAWAVFGLGCSPAAKVICRGTRSTVLRRQNSPR